MNKYIIRKAEPEDAQAVYKIICALEGENPEFEKFIAIFTNNLKDNNIYYIITEINNNPVGFASMHIQSVLHHTERIGEMLALYVDPEYRNRGIGETMYWNLKDTAEFNNCKYFEVACNIVRDKTIEFLKNKGLNMTHYKFTELL